MAGFEDLIRDTLLKQGEPTHATRARVYASARSALERMIAGRGAQGDPDDAQRQREQLEAAIERIEDEHAAHLFEPEPESSSEPVAPPAPPPVQSAPPPVPPMPPPTVAVAPVVPEPVAEPARGSGGERVAPPKRSRRDDKRSRRDEKRAARLLDGRPKRRPFAKLLLWVIILAGLATGGWWAYNFLSEQVEELGAVPNPVQLDVPADSGSLDGDWITVFDPAADIDAIRTGEAATSEIVREANSTWLRLASSSDPDAGENGRVRVAVPPGVMREIAGRRATFEANVRTAPGAAPHPFSVVCEFPAGVCNRTRFAAQANAQPFLFTADLQAGAEGGMLVLDTDLEGQGRAIDLGTIRVTSGE